ncbi:MAG: hypothetical protein Q8M11_15210 [Sulfuritalea sp.]|nr:hypothetical protein [Sulfuritalea sp.]
MAKPETGNAARCVIAVAAPIGGGKSALVQGLAVALNGAATLHFDDYELATRQSPAELGRWLEQGADFDSLQAPGFADAVRALRDDATIGSPSQFVVLEMPLGRAHADTAQLIDFLVWVDTPLDLALARNLRALTTEALADKADPRQFLGWLDAYLDQYMEQVRVILELQKKRVAPGADLVLDGTRSQPTLIAAAVSALIARAGGRAPVGPVQ